VVAKKNKELSNRYELLVDLLATARKNLSQIASTIKILTEQVSKEHGEAVDDFFIEIMKEIERDLGTLKQWEDINRVQEKVNEVLLYLNSGPASNAYISASNCHHAKLESAGAVKIGGKGCYHTEILAGGNVSVMGYPGIFRGGQIVARGDVEIKELGCPAETITGVQVVPHKKISAEKVYPNSILRVGSQIMRIQKLTRFVDRERRGPGQVTTPYLI
jgi:hypothetical protein